MSSQKPSIPKGTRDFTPLETIRREYIFSAIKDTFRNFGYQPIETPAMENLSTLMGKYGEEGDKLLFKILNSGDFLSKVPADAAIRTDSVKMTNHIAEKGLRYDLTVPFARFVVQNRNELNFPFKRYQIQPVWRADRPQKGRYREFYQCDADVIGSDSLLNEIELLQMIDDVFGKLNVGINIHLNNRKVLAGIAAAIGAEDKITDITVAIDKIDKIGIEKVNEELAVKGIDNEAIDKLQPILELSGTNREKLEKLDRLLKDSDTGQQGITELVTIFDYLENTPLSAEVKLDLTLARGLNYYTGAIIEVKATEVEIGSICGGGRYDNLTGIFGLDDVSGVGVSFGADRIYDVLLQLERFPQEAAVTTLVMFANFGEEETKYCLRLLDIMRKAGVSAELYPDTVKLKKQLNYANNKNIPFVVMVGEAELADGILTVKDMTSGDQQKLSADELLHMVKHTL